MKIKTTIYERPDMENPVYLVCINGKNFFIQRQEGMNPSNTAWYQVIKKNDFWENIGEHCLGWSKKEAIEYVNKIY